MATPIDVVVFKCPEIYPTGNRQNCVLFTCQPPLMCSQCSRFYPNRFTFGGVIAQCVKIIICSVEYLHDRLFEPIIKRGSCWKCSSGWHGTSVHYLYCTTVGQLTHHITQISLW